MFLEANPFAMSASDEREMNEFVFQLFCKKAVELHWPELSGFQLEEKAVRIAHMDINWLETDELLGINVEGN